MKLRDYKFYYVLSLFALVSALLVKMTGLDEMVKSKTLEHSPEYMSKGYTKWEMDETGKLKNKLTADSLVRYSDDGTTHMTNPVMIFENKDQTPPWVIKSETSIMSADGKDLQLNGKVVIDRAEGKGAKALTINSSNLRVKPETSYAETDEWAELISPPNRTTGTGMEMVFAKPVHLKLLDNVKGKYETN